MNNKISKVRTKIDDLMSELKDIKAEVKSYEYKEHVRNKDSFKIVCLNCSVDYDIEMSSANKPVFFCSRYCLRDFLKNENLALIDVILGNEKSLK